MEKENINLNQDNKESEYFLINYELINKEREKYQEHKYFSGIIKETKFLPDNLKYNTLLIIKILDDSNIDIKSLSSMVYNGLDESSELRGIVWRIFLNFLPKNIDEWESTLESKRSSYSVMKKKYIQNNKFINKKISDKEIDSINNDLVKEEDFNIINKSNSTKIEDLNKKKKGIKKTTTIDHPLESSNSSKWKSMFNDLDLFEEIHKDTKRTRTYMNFFTQKISEVTNLSGSDVLTNILFIFSKENPKIKYSQGMNEILAVILFCFSMGKNPYFKNFIEEDSYFCFCSLMNDMQSWYMDPSTAIPFKIKEFEILLKKRENEIFELFKKFNIDFQFFIFRWISLCFSQEYEMPDILRLWDSALSSNKDLCSFFSFYSIALLKFKHESFIKSDFSEIMLFVQNEVKSINIDKVLKYLINLDII